MQLPISPGTAIGYGVVVLLAVVDIWLSRMSSAAKVLWTVNVIFLVVVGPISWGLTRHTAHRDLDPIPNEG